MDNLLALRSPRWAAWTTQWRSGVVLSIVAALLSLAVANIVVRASWYDVEDGVLWGARPEGVVAVEIAAKSAASQAGIQTGDVLLAIDGQPVDSSSDVLRLLHNPSDQRGRLTYTVLRLGTRQVRELVLQPVPQGSRAQYFVLAGVAIFTLLVGLAVRLRRPTDQATLHFFWLCVAFFGVGAYSFSGRLDRLDWIFYWCDVVAMVLLPPLFVHFSLVFPDRPREWIHRSLGRAALPALYVPALLLLGTRIGVLSPAGPRGPELSRLIDLVDRLELTHLSLYLIAGFVFVIRALSRVRSVTARRQLWWIVAGAFGGIPFALGYGLPYSLGIQPPGGVEFTAIPLALIPLAFASAIVRYRLMDVEVIIKRAVVYSAAVASIAVMYWVLLRVAGALFLHSSDQYNTVVAGLATFVVVMLARPVKNAIQTTLDRAYYRDRYDYRRALVGFARDLNSDLDLNRLSERLVARVMETLLVDRMTLMLAPSQDGAASDFAPIRFAGFETIPPPSLSSESGIGTRLLSGHAIALDDPLAARRFSIEEVTFWRDHGIHYFVPCVSKEGTIAVMALGRKESGELLNSEDVALLAAVAGQVATALENGRLYRQLRLKAEELNRMREFSENILESLNDGLAVLDTEERVIRWNTGLERLYGISRTDAIGKKIDALFDYNFLRLLHSAPEDARTSVEGANLYRVPVLSRHPEGRRRLLVNTATAPVLSPDGASAGTVLILEDITARVQLEEQLQISEKMASIGLLAAGVAHEVNTPLTGISSFTQMLLEGADTGDPRTRLLEKIEQQTFRAAKIVNGLLRLARPSHVDTGPIDVNAVINDVLSLLEHQFKMAKIQVRKELCDIPPFVRGVEYKLQQVFLNLFLNARDAMPKGGWLSIATHVSGSDAVIEVADTGGGIPNEHISRIYDPFFTTKPIGHGTGLGLSITYGIVQEHEGSIACNSTVGQGTRFVLTLPLASGSRQRAGEATP